MLQALDVPCARPVNGIELPETTETVTHMLRRPAGPYHPALVQVLSRQHSHGDLTGQVKRIIRFLFRTVFLSGAQLPQGSIPGQLDVVYYISMNDIAAGLY